MIGFAFSIFDKFLGVFCVNYWSIFLPMFLSFLSFLFLFIVCYLWLKCGNRGFSKIYKGFIIDDCNHTINIAALWAQVPSSVLAQCVGFPCPFCGFSLSTEVATSKSLGTDQLRCSSEDLSAIGWALSFVDPPISWSEGVDCYQ